MRTEICMRMGIKGITFEHILKRMVDLPLIPKGYIIDEGIVFRSYIETTIDYTTQYLIVNYEGSLLNSEPNYDKISSLFKKFKDYEDF